MLQSVLHALQTGWMVIYVPNPLDWFNASSAYTPELTAAPSEGKKEMYAQLSLTMQWLKKLQVLNGDLFQSRKLSQDYQQAAKGTSWSELFNQHSSPALLNLITRELQIDDS